MIKHLHTTQRRFLTWVLDQDDLLYGYEKVWLKCVLGDGGYTKSGAVRLNRYRKYFGPTWTKLQRTSKTKI